jgi:hypothetical protein
MSDSCSAERKTRFRLCEDSMNVNRKRHAIYTDMQGERTNGTITYVDVHLGKVFKTTTRSLNGKSDLDKEKRKRKNIRKKQRRRCRNKVILHTSIIKHC